MVLTRNFFLGGQSCGSERNSYARASAEKFAMEAMQTRPSKDWAFSVVQASECLRCKDDALPLFFATGRRIQQIVNWLCGLIMNPPGAVCQLRRGRVCQSRRERIALKPQPLRIYTHTISIFGWSDCNILKQYLYMYCTITVSFIDISF